MTDDAWRWDETLFLGTAAYYARGRLAYPAALADVLADALALDGHGRLIDVGCGPGTIALPLAHFFDEAVGVDPDTGMLAEAERTAAERGIANARWVQLRAEDLPAGLGHFRVATFSRSFHWMDRDRVTAIMREMLDPSGAFVQVTEQLSEARSAKPVAASATPHSPPPNNAIADLIKRYLGPDRRAGQGIRKNSPSGETIVIEGAGFLPPQIVRIPSEGWVARDADDVVAHVLSMSQAAPHLFGDDLPRFEHDLRALLTATSPDGVFSERLPETELRIWRVPEPRAV